MDRLRPGSGRASGCRRLVGVRLRWLIFAGVSEVPYGYQRISYETLQPDPSKPTEPIPQTAIDMQDRKVYIKGYMQSRRTLTGIKEFILCPTNGECPFCTPNPKRTEMIRVILQGDLEATYTTHLIGVAGRFRVDLERLQRNPLRPGCRLSPLDRASGSRPLPDRRL